MGVAVVLLANVFFGGGKCPNLGVVNLRILGVVNVRLANNLTPYQLLLLSIISNLKMQNESIHTEEVEFGVGHKSLPD